ncbi:MAG: hypothetical protein SNJ74_10160 [Fimbriimonadaceae bacterium]
MTLVPHAIPFLAYIDGGSASMFFQALIGGALAAGYFATAKIGSILSKFRPAARKSNSDGR